MSALRLLFYAISLFQVWCLDNSRLRLAFVPCPRRDSGSHQSIHFQWRESPRMSSEEHGENQAEMSDDPAHVCDQPTSSSLWFGNDEALTVTPAQQSLARYVEHVQASLLEGQFSTQEGVACDGEPSVDPSRQIQAQGDSEWMEDW